MYCTVYLCIVLAIHTCILSEIIIDHTHHVYCDYWPHPSCILGSLTTPICILGWLTTLSCMSWSLTTPIMYIMIIDHTHHIDHDHWPHPLCILWSLTTPILYMWSLTTPIMYILIINHILCVYCDQWPHPSYYDHRPHPSCI